MTDLMKFDEAFRRFQDALDDLGIGAPAEIHLTRDGYIRLMLLVRNGAVNHLTRLVPDPKDRRSANLSYSGTIIRPVRASPNYAPDERVLELARDLMKLHGRTLELLKDSCGNAKRDKT